MDFVEIPLPLHAKDGEANVPATLSIDANEAEDDVLGVPSLHCNESHGLSLLSGAIIHRVHHSGGGPRMDSAMSGPRYGNGLRNGHHWQPAVWFLGGSQNSRFPSADSFCRVLPEVQPGRKRQRERVKE